MRKGRFSEEQIIAILREVEAGKKVEEVARAHKISTHTIYMWRKKFRGMEVQDAKRLREIEAENIKLKKLVANLSLDNLVLKDALGKK